MAIPAPAKSPSLAFVRPSNIPAFKFSRPSGFYSEAAASWADLIVELIVDCTIPKSEPMPMPALAEGPFDALFIASLVILLYASKANYSSVNFCLSSSVSSIGSPLMSKRRPSSRVLP